MLMNKKHETAARPPPELDTKQGMVINCAAYQGGCRVADIDLDQAREVDTRGLDRFARTGSSVAAHGAATLRAA
jgi:hypothetical protein